MKVDELISASSIGIINGGLLCLEKCILCNKHSETFTNKMHLHVMVMYNNSIYELLKVDCRIEQVLRLASE